MAEKKMPIGSILLQQRTVSAKQLADALENQPHGDERLVSSLIDAGVIREREALKALSEQSGCPGIDLNQVVIKLEHLKMVPKPIARHHCIIPLVIQGKRLYVAMADPRDLNVIKELEMITGKTAFPYIALRSALQRVIDEAYALRDDGQAHYVGPNCSPETLKEAGLE